MVLRAHGAPGIEVDMTDRIVLTIPAGARFRGVATLVLGGIGGRMDLPYERMDDLHGSSRDDGLRLVLSRLVDGVAHERRDGAEWITFGVSNAGHAPTA